MLDCNGTVDVGDADGRFDAFATTCFNELFNIGYGLGLISKEFLRSKLKEPCARKQPAPGKPIGDMAREVLWRVAHLPTFVRADSILLGSKCRLINQSHRSKEERP